MEIKEQIEALKAKLTGDLFQDGELMMEIYNLKKQLNPEIETNPEAWKKDFELVLKVQMILFFNSCRNLGYIHFCVGKPNYAKIFNYFSSTSKFNHYI